MNEADAINALCYALQEIEIIANGGMLGMTDWSEEDEQARLDEIAAKVDGIRSELLAYGSGARGGLWIEANV
jgi:hypothetical protein